MTRQLIKNGSAVHGWYIADRDLVTIYAYSKGFIGTMKAGCIYDEKGELIGLLDIDISLEDYIVQRNGKIDVGAMRMKLNREKKKLAF